jgi:hypothetical protein
VDPQTLKELRRGWYLGDQAFRTELLEQMNQKMGAEHYGEERHGWKESELGLRPNGEEVKIALAKTVATGNDDDAEMDCRAIANGQLDVCLQPAGGPRGSETKLQSVNSENRPLYLFLGWAREHTGWLNASDNTPEDVEIAKAGAKTLQLFYTDWMNRVTLKECVDHACLSLTGTAPFPVPENKNCLIILGDGVTYLATNMTTSRIVIVGHPGLAVDRTDSRVDADQTYKRK